MKQLIKCDVCGKHFSHPRYELDDGTWVFPSHYDFGVCSVECWAEHINIHDENLADRFTEEKLEMAEYLADN
jgi:hypothetical protein